LVEVENRINSLGKLDDLKASLKDTTWAKLRNTMSSNLKLFANKVLEGTHS